MRYITLLLALVLGALLLGCQYVAPPGGEGAYCYRVDYEPAYTKGGGVILLTNTAPEWVDEHLVVEDAWLTFNKDDGGAAVRFDRYVDEVTLSPDLAQWRRVSVTTQGICAHWGQEGER